MTTTDIQLDWQQRITAHYRNEQPLHIIGGNTKSFYGRACQGETLNTTAHQGILEYEPSELVLQARTGTPLKLIEATLAEQNQMLAFEPPHFGEQATLGGCIATGLAGPRRPYTGSVRDYVLGATVINGKGELLKFGGKVMKNVAGYDVARLYTGSLGTLGLILDVAVKVLPQPEAESTIRFELNHAQAMQRMQQLAQQPLPLSAMAYDGAQLYLRMSGTARAVQHAQTTLGGDVLAQNDSFWRQVREQTHPFFQKSLPLWRLSLPPAAPAIPLSSPQWIDWGGAQRWLFSDADAHTIYQLAESLGGHATLFRGGDRQAEVLQPLTGKLKELHLNTKLAFDPHCIFNPGRMYSYY